MSFCRNTCTVLIALLTYHYVELSDSKRQERSAIQPCLACTPLNKVQCCQKHGRCCSNQAATNQNANSRVTQSPRVDNKRPPLQPVKVRYRPVGGLNVMNRRTCPANREVYGMLKKRDCTPCNPDGLCPSPNTRCCPPPVQCCRRLDFQNYCPLTEISARCCRRCVSANNCRAGEGCCAQPGHQGCCLANCGANARNCPGRNSVTNLRPTSDQSTIQVPTSVPATEIPSSASSNRPPDRVSTLTLDRDGGQVEVVVTIRVDASGRTNTLVLNDGGGYDTLTDIVEVTKTHTDVVEVTLTEEKTVTVEGDVEVTLIETVLDGTTYTATPIGNHAYTLTKTSVINNVANYHVVTVYDPTTTRANVGETVTVTESFISDLDVENNQLQPSFTTKFY